MANPGVRAVQAAGVSTAAFTSAVVFLAFLADFAAGTAGQAVVEQLAVLTGADVAASDDATGSAARGGDWVLEYQAGVGITAVHAWSTRRQPGDVTIPYLIDWDQVEDEHRQQLSEALAPWIKRYPNVDVT